MFENIFKKALKSEKRSKMVYAQLEVDNDAIHLIFLNYFLFKLNFICLEYGNKRVVLLASANLFMVSCLQFVIFFRCGSSP